MAKKMNRSAVSVHAVILAGGAGERFWPASRRERPKPFLRVVGGKTLLEATLQRARAFAEADQIWIVCGHEHARAMRAESGLRPSRILVEPQRRNTAMAVSWAAERISAEDPDAVMAVLSADHHIPDRKAFALAIKDAARAAADEGVLVTLGVRPSRPETGYGYIHQGSPASSDHPRMHRVRRFVEKPDSARAIRFVQLGDYLWNAGVFVWSARSLLEEVERYAAPLHRALAPLRKNPRGRNQPAVEAAYRRAPSLPIDVAVMEKSDRVWTIPVDFAWSDVGTWLSLAEELGVGVSGSSRQSSGHARRDAQGNCFLEGDVLAEESAGNLVWGGGRLVALLGVDDLAVVDTDDVILITKLERSPDVRRLVAALKSKGRENLT
ncbi:MAG: sugar phosphate nucleotidyltransferase [Myxococcota bacterium]|nr:sugar phosphate nucleotidyltransferase [Myxococcota bacterium]